MPEQVSFWKWITPKLLGLVTQTSVYHWSIEGDSEPVKMFDRIANLANTQVINFRCDPSEKWLVLIGIAPGSPEPFSSKSKKLPRSSLLFIRGSSSGIYGTLRFGKLNPLQPLAKILDWKVEKPEILQRYLDCSPSL